MALTRYREVLRAPSVGWLLTTSLVGRLPQGMTGLALLLLVTRHGTYAAAGAVTAVFLVATCLATPLVSRAADRLGRRRVLRATACGFAVASLGLAASAAHPVPLVVFALLAGASSPPLAASARAVWPALVTGAQRQSLFALEATLQEMTFIAGPALVALLAAAGSAALAVAASGAICLAGTIAFTADAAADSGMAERGAKPGAAVLGSAPLRHLIAAGVALVAALSIAEVGIVAFVSGSQASAGAGVALALWSAGSLVGGAIFGSIPVTRTPLTAFLATAAVGFGVLAAAPTTLALSALLFVGGSAIAPALALLYTRVGALAPAGATTEAFGWLSSGLMAGAAAGVALGGVVVSSHGPRVAFLAATGVGLLAAAVAEPIRGWRRRVEVDPQVCA